MNRDSLQMWEENKTRPINTSNITTVPVPDGLLFTTI